MWEGSAFRPRTATRRFGCLPGHQNRIHPRWRVERTRKAMFMFLVIVWHLIADSVSMRRSCGSSGGSGAARPAVYQFPIVARF
jgi:hypothetical protein